VDKEFWMLEVQEKLKSLYPDQWQAVYRELMSLMDTTPTHPQKLALSESDAMLIVYGDHVRRPGEPPLETLHDVLHHLNLPLTSVHILPFYPYSSDDGFSVIDYYQVDPALGGWHDIHRLSSRYRLMFDAVFNHISAQSNWFQGFLQGESPYTDYLVTLPPDTDLS
jgi:glucosylglycerate phosphorylase